MSCFVRSAKLNNGQTIPLLGLGTWKSEPGEVAVAVKEAIRMGYRHIDCAHIYGNEKEIGEALSEIFADGVCERKDLFITSKLWNDSHGFDEVMPALKNTLANLRLDYIDMYLSECGSMVLSMHSCFIHPSPLAGCHGEGIAMVRHEIL
jgi:diketogulonate reductase-like aldo/keto reductase